MLKCTEQSKLLKQNTQTKVLFKTLAVAKHGDKRFKDLKKVSLLKEK